MKKVLSMICAVAICLGMVGCRGNKPVGDDPTAVYLDGEKVISLGMTEDEIEEVLKADEIDYNLEDDQNPERLVKSYENSNIFVEYIKNIPHMMWWDKKEYSDCFGIHLEMTIEEAKEILRNASIDLEKTCFLETEFVLCFDKKGKQVITDKDMILNEEKMYSCITYCFDSEKKNIDDIVILIFQDYE